MVGVIVGSGGKEDVATRIPSMLYSVMIYTNNSPAEL
jgi:hypothetical protein